MSIDLTDIIVKLAQRQATAAGFTDVAEYIAWLIRGDQPRVFTEYLDRQLQVGLDSGDPVRMTQEDWLRMRRELQQHHAQQANSAGVSATGKSARCGPLELAGTLADDPWIAEICEEAYRLRDAEPRE